VAATGATAWDIYPFSITGWGESFVGSAAVDADGSVLVGSTSGDMVKIIDLLGIGVDTGSIAAQGNRRETSQNLESPPSAVAVPVAASMSAALGPPACRGAHFIRYACNKHYTLRLQQADGAGREGRMILVHSVEERNALVLEHLRLVQWLVRRRLSRVLKETGFPKADALQVGYLALLRAAQRWVPSRGVAFGAYATDVILWRIFRAARTDWLIRLPDPMLPHYAAWIEQAMRIVPINSVIGTRWEPCEERTEEHWADQLAGGLARLTWRQRQVVRMRFLTVFLWNKPAGS
jgi:hypothetical protein